ncbi:MAG: aminomethyl-transferring glycine dehydrogenase subunit GcvPA, partial [Deinococcus sp.]|nr:aminomethyl-transferring glycine dehydrogenase subunit GcvPA [Deinococcus sp.]
MQFTPHTPEDIRRALERIGAQTVDELFDDLPQELRHPPLDLPPGMNEPELTNHLLDLAGENEELVSFLGGGIYRHFSPAVVERLAGRSEFYTSYTPYQPEVSQGLLQSIFEYQTLMSELTGLPVSNASMYDGASATAEAALLAARATGGGAVYLSRALHPEYRRTVRTYAAATGLEVRELPCSGGVTAPASDLGDAAAVMVPQPNFFGQLEDMAAWAQAAHSAEGLFIAVVNPLSLALLKPPGEYGADVACGDGQSLGLPMNFGGPHFGFLVVSEALVRQLPGRIVGQTQDTSGRRAFVLTLQAREQHIRREKATSNICTNHALMALRATIHLSALGPQGLRQVAEGAVRRAHQLAQRLCQVKGFHLAWKGPFFNEFVLRLPLDPQELNQRLLAEGIQGGLP